MLSVSFLNMSTLFRTACCLRVHKPFHPISEESPGCGRIHICTISLISSSLVYIHPWKASLMVQTCDNLMELDLDYMVGVEEVQISAGCFDVAATECVRAFSWSTITFICSVQCTRYCANAFLENGSHPAVLQQCNSENGFVRFKEDL